MAKYSVRIISKEQVLRETTVEVEAETEETAMYDATQKAKASGGLTWKDVPNPLHVEPSYKAHQPEKIDD